MCPQQRAHVGPQLLAACRRSREPAHQCDPRHIHTLRVSEGGSMRSKGGDPHAPRATIHSIKEGDPHDPREAIHGVLHTIQGRRSTRSEGGDPCVPREVSTSSEGVDPHAKVRKVTMHFRGGHSRQGMPSTRSREVPCVRYDSKSVVARVPFGGLVPFGGNLLL